ncbi:hypothetical protein KSS87_020258 [Heliosperma pusillum]|nr:hypothetical protein KSS87_020258 [Heliosperma pusillum]
MATPTPATSTTSEGPVLTLISKRIRALRKKHTRILQMEQSLSQGKTLNSEQLDVIRSKPAVETLIDELEKLRAPLSAALDEELSLSQPQQQPQQPPQHDEIMDLVKLMYFGSLFDVKAHSEFTSLMYTKTLERGSCLSYDIVTDDAVDADMLIENDLDLISALQGLMIARPVNSELSHQNALELCLNHAKLWLSNAHHPIDSQTNVTYAALREKLNKIISSGYFIATPQMRGAGEVAAAAADGNFGLLHVPTQESMVNVEVPVQVEGSTEQYQETKEDAGNYEEYETAGQQSNNLEVFQKDDLEPENPPEVVPSQIDQDQPQHTEGENGYSNVDFKDQQYGQRRGHRGGSRGGGRRGHSNGRGGRGTGRGNGAYQNNGRGQYYDNNYYPRNNYYNRRGGRGGGGGGGYYNNSSGDHGNHSQENIGAES